MEGKALAASLREETGMLLPADSPAKIARLKSL